MFKVKIQKKNFEPTGKEPRWIDFHFMVSDDGVEIRTDGTDYGGTLYFKYMDKDRSFRFSGHRGEAANLPVDEMQVVVLRSVVKDLLPEKVSEILKNIEEALLAWPADVPELRWPVFYLYKQIPVRRIDLRIFEDRSGAVQGPRSA